VKCSEALRLLLKDGWYVVSQNGSHIKLKHESKDGIIVFPNHGSQELGKGLQKKLFKKAGIKIWAMKNLKKKIDITVEKTATGYSSYTNDMSVFTTGNDIPELYSNLIEALNLAYEELGFEVTAENLKLNLDLQQFFKYYKVLNANFLAKRIGMNPTLLSQYVQGKKHPSSKQTDKIIRGIQGIGKELADIRLVVE
jgi:predicted RNA binding protein YcfA (HicA-like mRNA interferase family)